MKPLSNLLLLVGLAVFFVGCEKGIEKSDCDNAVTFARQVENVYGRVYFDSSETKHMILVPNSLDSHDVGFVCALPSDYQKEGLQVKFSGRYYTYNKMLLPRFAGDQFYSLSIDAISLR